MSQSSPAHWTSGAPKWAAVIVLGAAAILGLGWAVGRDGSGWGKPHADIAALAATAPNPSPKTDPAPTAVPIPAPKTQTPALAPALRKLINVNTATQAELELLPGIGPALAKRIMDHRAAKPFKRIEDLDNVKGIGPRTLERLRPLITVE